MAPSYHRHYSLCQASAAKPARSALQLAAEAFTRRSRERFFKFKPQIVFTVTCSVLPQQGGEMVFKGREKAWPAILCSPRKENIFLLGSGKVISFRPLGMGFKIPQHYFCLHSHLFFLSYVFISFPLSQTKHCMMFTDLFLANSKKSVKYLKSLQGKKIICQN